MLSPVRSKRGHLGDLLREGITRKMEQITNNRTVQECSQILGHQVENIPQLDTSKIQLVSEVNPKLLRVSTISKANNDTNSSSLTVYTTPTDKDFYLTTVSLSILKDVTATSVLSRILVTTEDGVTGVILPIPGISLTPQNAQSSISFAYPLKLKRNTTIIATNSTNVGNIVYGAGITGFTVDTLQSIL